MPHLSASDEGIDANEFVGARYGGTPRNGVIGGGKKVAANGGLETSVHNWRVAHRIQAASPRWAALPS
jgi:hypothetical protein